MQPGEETIGKELWELTWAVIENFRFCPNLKEELFGALQQSPRASEATTPALPEGEGQVTPDHGAVVSDYECTQKGRACHSKILTLSYMWVIVDGYH